MNVCICMDQSKEATMNLEPLLKKFRPRFEALNTTPTPSA